MNQPYKIGIIGTGNMAYFLGKQLQYSVHPIHGIYGRNASAAKQLAESIEAAHFEDMYALAAAVDVLFLAVNDDAIESVAAALSAYPDKIVVHHSGTLPLAALKTKFEKCGVFWPIYSINRQQLPKHRNIPIIINTNDTKVQTCLLSIAAAITDQYEVLPEEKRKALHLMAVMTNNFMNHLAAIAQDLGKEKEVLFEWVIPIIQQTAERIQHAPHIADLQTGPAIRNDEQTMNNHLSLLADHPAWQDLYRAISQSIIDYPKK